LFSLFCVNWATSQSTLHCVTSDHPAQKKDVSLDPHQTLWPPFLILSLVRTTRMKWERGSATACSLSHCLPWCSLALAWLRWRCGRWVNTRTTSKILETIPGVESLSFLSSFKWWKESFLSSSSVGKKSVINWMMTSVLESSSNGTRTLLNVLSLTFFLIF